MIRKIVRKSLEWVSKWKCRCVNTHTHACTGTGFSDNQEKLVRFPWREKAQAEVKFSRGEVRSTVAETPDPRIRRLGAGATRT